MAITVVQTATGVQDASGTFGTATFPGPTTAGNAILVARCMNGTLSATGETFHTAINTAGGAFETLLSYAYDIVGGWTVLTDTYQFNVGCCGTTYFPEAFVVYEIAGLTLTNPLDQTAKHNGNPGSTNAQTGTTATTTSASELVFGSVQIATASLQSITPPPGWTNPLNNFNSSEGAQISTALQIVSTAGTEGGTFTLPSSHIYEGCVATFTGVPAPTIATSTVLFGGRWRLYVPVGSSYGGPAIVRNWQQEAENIDDEELAVLLTI